MPESKQQCVHAGCMQAGAYKQVLLASGASERLLCNDEKQHEAGMRNPCAPTGLKVSRSSRASRDTVSRATKQTSTRAEERHLSAMFHRG